MEKTIWIGSLSGPNLKSKTCTELSRSVQNLQPEADPPQAEKWLGLSVIAFLLVVTAAVATAQQPKKVHRIGYLSSFDPANESTRSEGIRLALRERGYVEGQNVATEYRYTAGKLDRFSELAAELRLPNLSVSQFSRFVDIKTIDMIEVIVTAGKSRQIVARDKSGVYGVIRKQSVAGHQVIGVLKDSVVKRKDSQEGEQGKGLMKVHFLQHRTVTLEVEQDPLRRNLFVFDDTTAKINEQSFRSNDRRSKSRDRAGLYSLEKVAAGTAVKLILKQVVDENIGVNENA